MKEMIGIIAAMQEEMEAIKIEMTEIEEIQHKDIIFYIGKLSDKNCILVKSGVGKVNAARITQLLIDKYLPKMIINVGSAGGLKDNVKCGDIIVGKELVQHDFDITAFGHEKGYITDLGKSFYSDNDLIEKAYKIITNISKQDYNVKIGKIASGDTFFTSMKKAEKLIKDFNSDCVEMEGAAIAQVCYLEETPFICIRSISDTPNENNNIEFDKYLKMASERCSKFVLEFVK